MSTLAALDVRTMKQQRASAWHAAFASILAVAGLTTIWSSVLFLWALWTTDALKSIGMIVPLVSFVLILRVWRGLEWEMDGTWWGLVLLVVTIAAVRLRDQATLVLVVSPQWSMYVPPHSLVVFAYASGVVLLFGGTRLYRAALFPIFLLWLVNPVPHIFNVLVDLPLQSVSAHLARGFAMALGQPLSPDHLRLMFTPDFGMFIAPGCNGIRGAVTMGMIALVAGYLYRFRWVAHALIVVGAILLGYVFNFLRLFVLVLYYLLALHFTFLQSKAKTADYLLGAVLFLLATLLLIAVIRRLGSSAQRPALPVVSPMDTSPTSLYSRLALMLVVALFGLAGLARASIGTPTVAASQSVMGTFPTSIGSYTLLRTWNENLVTGPLIFHWAEYGGAANESHVAIGVSPVLGSHETLICHSARGEEPLWLSQLTVPTAGGVPVSFSASFYNNGVTQYIEATTLCNGSSCGEYAAGGRRFGLVYSRPSSQSLLRQDVQRPIPILIKVETTDMNLPADFAREQMTQTLVRFVSSASLDQLTLPYRHQQ